jgi:DNA-binding GntR family transcriptional regulator
MRRRIESGKWPKGMALRGVFELAQEYGCSMEVVRQAEHILADQGWLNRPRQGLWTRVAGRPELSAHELLVEIRDAYCGLGKKLEALDAALGELLQGLTLPDKNDGPLRGRQADP